MRERECDLYSCPDGCKNFYHDEGDGLSCIDCGKHKEETFEERMDPLCVNPRTTMRRKMEER